MFKNKKVFNNSGFTLIEVIITVVIFGIIFIPILNLYYNTQVDHLSENRRIKAQSEISTALRLITDDLRKVESGTINAKPAIEISAFNDILVIRLNTIEIAYGISSGKLYKYQGSSIDISTIGSTELESGIILIEDMTNFNVALNSKTYNISLTVDPPDAGHNKVVPIPVSTSFTPRFNI